jgi:hypothetical protein
LKTLRRLHLPVTGFENERAPFRNVRARLDELPPDSCGRPLGAQTGDATATVAGAGPFGRRRTLRTRDQRVGAAAGPGVAAGTALDVAAVGGRR